ncbi:MAG: GtrA family protein [Anaerolineaceae bacterium]|nr:GtrA family protein [Anaerolineaceae bacterium]
MIITDPLERSRFLRFAMVGVIGAVVDFSVANLLTGVFHMEFIWASIISFTAAVISNFLWNRFWTYPDSRSKPVSSQVMQFLLISIIGLVIRTPIIKVLEIPMISLFTRMDPKVFVFTPRFMGHNATLAIAVLVVMMWNFFANRFWTYNDVS